MKSSATKQAETPNERKPYKGSKIVHFAIFAPFPQPFQGPLDFPGGAPLPKSSRRRNEGDLHKSSKVVHFAMFAPCPEAISMGPLDFLDFWPPKAAEMKRQPHEKQRQAIASGYIREQNGSLSCYCIT